MTHAPAEHRLLAALEATWPAAGYDQQAGWLLRNGAGGGKRVSAASPLGPAPDISAAETALRAQGQRPLFRLCAKDGAVDARLEARGYMRRDPTLILAAPVAALAQRPELVRLFPLWPPLAIMRDIWAEGGVGPERLAIMARAHGAKAALLARMSDRAAGVAFCACDGEIAMLHAMHVLPAHRGKGLGKMILRGAADWAQQEGARWLALVVTEDNSPARALYSSCGLRPAARYHYREETDHDRPADSP
jgi:N-acetylglutamate synthase